jgi:hypothetical protein
MTPSISPITRAFVALLVALASVGIGAQAAIGGGGGDNTAVLGKTKDAPRPNCPATQPPPPQSEFEPKDACQVTGQVTGYQKSADGKKGIFKVREDGHIVAWSVDLSDPSKSERRTFGEASQTDQYGKAPTAGISIIRRQEDKIFKLKSASPILNVRSFYGEKPTFTLAEPLPVKEGDVVALTTATWLPAFSIIDQTEDDVWVSSREEKDWVEVDGEPCSVPQGLTPEERLEYFFDASSPHRKVGSERKYECKYDESRLLYWAYFVKG